jgi:predicted glycosyltransferase
MVSSCRVCVYSQDSLGLGHLRRNILIGEALLAGRKDANVLLFADSPVAPFFKLPDRMDHVKLPCIRKVSAGCWEATRLRMDEQELIRLRANLLTNVLVNFRPDLLLVDHMPGGAQGELLPAVKALKQACPDCRMVLGLRDILDAPEVTQRVWESDGAYEALRRYYDRILIYGSKEMFTTCSIYRLPVPLNGTHYCGYVVKRDPVRRASDFRQTVRLPRRRYVFVSAGGGGDGQLLMQTYVRAMRILGARADFATLMAVGVNAPPDFERTLATEARGLPIRILPYVDDSPSCIAAADLVVCMAGYNTLSEVLYLKKKALVVPRGGPSAEQRTRARLFAQHQLVDVLDPTDLSPEELAKRLLKDLERNDYPPQSGNLPMDGAAQAADRLLELLQEKEYEVMPRA